MAKVKNTGGTNYRQTTGSLTPRYCKIIASLRLRSGCQRFFGRQRPTACLISQGNTFSPQIKNQVLKGPHGAQIAHPDDAAEVANAWRYSINSGKDFAIEHRVKFYDGIYQPVLSRAKAVTDGSGDIRGCVGVNLSADTQAGASDALRLKAEARYRALVVAASAIVYECGADGQFMTPQPSWQRYTGQPWEEHHGFGWSEMIHPEDRAIAQAALSESLSTDLLDGDNQQVRRSDNHLVR